MSHLNNINKIFVVFSLLLFLFVSSALVLEAQNKDFYFPEVRIDVNIQKDGSFTVDEFRTYEFQGRFSWAMLWIPLRVNRNGSS